MNNDKIDKLLQGINEPDNNDDGDESQGMSRDRRNGVITSLSQLPPYLRSAIVRYMSEQEGDRSKDVVVDRIPMRPEWKQYFVKLTDIKEQGKVMADEMQKQIEAMDRRNKMAWAVVENDLEDSRNMEYDPVADEIIIYEEK